MSSHWIAAALLVALQAGAHAADAPEAPAAAVPPAAENLILHLRVEGLSGVHEPAKNIQLHFTNAQDDRSTDAAGNLKIRLAPGKHTVHALTARPCRFDFSIPREKVLELTLLIPASSSGKCIFVPAHAADIEAQAVKP